MSELLMTQDHDGSDGAEAGAGPQPAPPVVAEPDHRLPLREARESEGLSVDEVATQLNLGPETILALEAGDYDRLPPPTFVRGYLRGYARLLRLDANRLLDQYDASRPTDPEITRVSTVGTEPGSGHPAVRWATKLIVVGLIGMAVLWWYREYREPVAPTPVVESNPAVTGESMPTPSPIERVRRPTVVRAGEEPEPAQPAPAAMAADRPITGESAAERPDANRVAGVPGSAVEPLPEPLVPGPAPNLLDPPAPPPPVAEPAPSALEPVPAAPAAAPAVGAAPTPAEPAATAGLDLLVVSAEGESWLEVNDADDRQLYFDLLRSGQPATLRGRAPFQVFLGNSPAVSLKVNGVDIDQAGFTRGNNTARFVVDQDGVRRR